MASMDESAGYSCKVTTSYLLICSEDEGRGGLSDEAPRCRSDVNTPPYPPYLELVFWRGVSHSRIAMRRGGWGIVVVVRRAGC